MVLLPDNLQQLLRAHHVDSYDADRLQVIIDSFTDPLSQEEFVALVQLHGISQILLTPGTTNSSDPIFFQHAVMAMARFFSVHQNVSLAKRLLQSALDTVDQITGEWDRYLARKILIEAFAENDDFVSAKHIVDSSEGQYRLRNSITLALAYHRSGRVAEAETLLAQAETLVQSVQIDVEIAHEVSDAFITLGMAERARKYLEMRVPLIQNNEQQHGDQFSHWSWAQLCVEYAKLGELEMVKKMADLSPRERWRAIRLAVSMFVERGNLSDAEKAIAHMDIAPDESSDDEELGIAYYERAKAELHYQRARAMIHFARGLHRQGNTPEAMHVLDQVRDGLDSAEADPIANIRLLGHLASAFKYLSDLSSASAAIEDLDQRIAFFYNEIEREHGEQGVNVFVGREVYRYVRRLIEFGSLARAKTVLKRYLSPGKLWFDSSRRDLSDGYAQDNQYAEAIRLLKGDSQNMWLRHLSWWARDDEKSNIEDWEPVLREAVNIACLVDFDWRPVGALLAKETE